MIAFLAGCLLAASVPVNMPADTLESVSVTGSRIPLALGQSARIVTVLDSVAIAASPATSVNDLLKYAVGVDVRQRGAQGMQTDISIRGGIFDQIAILLDGVNISDPQTGHNAVDFPVELSQIERIEILEGPAARTYGTSSLLGAVNIVTKGIRDRGASVRLEGGSFGLRSGGAALGFRASGIVHHLSGSVSASDGYSKSAAGTQNTDFKAGKAFWRGDYERGKLSLSWHAGLSSKGFGSSTFYSPRFDDQFEKTFKTFTSLRARTSFGKFTFSPSLYWNHGTDRFELFRGKPDAYPYNYHSTDVIGANLSLRRKGTAVGLEIRREGIVSTNLGEPLPSPRPGPDGAEYKCGLARTDYSFYTEHNVVKKLYTASAGFVIHKNTGNDEPLRVYPGADFSLRLSPSWKLYTSYKNSWRMPTFTELYYSVGGHKADKNLKAEKMHSVEGGLKFLRPGVRAIATVWHHRGKDMIDWVRDTSDPDAPWESVNHSRIRSTGEELTFHFDLPVLLGDAVFPVTNLDFCYGHISQNKVAEEGIQSYYALEYLRNKIVVRADVRLWKGLTLDASWRWQDRVGSYQEYDAGTATGKTVAYEPYSLLDAKINWIVALPRLSGSRRATATGKSGRAPVAGNPGGGPVTLRLYLAADNLLDRVWYDHGNILQPGRWVRFGLQMDLR